MESEHRAFLQAITDDRYDEVSRRVFADYLEEHGFDDEASEQRLWTKEKQESIDWLEEYAKKLSTDPYYDPADPEDFNRAEKITYDKLLEAAYTFLDNRWGDHIILSFDTPDWCYENPGRFWEHFERATGRVVDESKKDNTIVSCSC